MKWSEILDYCHYVAQIKIDNEDTAKEIAAMAVEKVVMYRSSYDSKKASFKTWLNRIVHNCIADFFKRRLSYNEDNNLEQLLISSCDYECILTKLDKKMKLKLIKNGLNSLSPKLQQIMLCLFFENLTPKETCEKLSIPYNNIISCKMRAIKKLKQIVN
jgi:RNA polymerase sigma factor (sigma-70 family)